MHSPRYRGHAYVSKKTDDSQSAAAREEVVEYIVAEGPADEDGEDQCMNVNCSSVLSRSVQVDWATGELIEPVEIIEVIGKVTATSMLFE